MGTHDHLHPTRRGVFALVGATLLLTAACGGSSTTAASGAGAGAVAGVHVATTSLGKTVVAGNGRTLYLLTSDKAGSTTCTGSCLQTWPPVTVRSANPSASGVDADLATLARGSARQLTIGGHPVYTYAADSGPGKTQGEGLKSFGGTWYAVSPAGSAIKGTPVPMGGNRYGY